MMESSISKIDGIKSLFDFFVEKNVRCLLGFHVDLELLILFMKFELSNIGIIHISPACRIYSTVVSIVAMLDSFANMEQHSNQLIILKLPLDRLSS